MGSIRDKSDDEAYYITEKGEIGFVDYEDNRSVCSYNPNEEGPIVISIPFPLADGKPRSILVGETISEAITIKNTTTEPAELWKVGIYDSNPKDSFTVSLMEPPSATSDEEYIRGFLESFCLEDRILQPGQTLTVWLSCKPKEIGLQTTAVHFDVGEQTIERLVLLLAEDTISRSLASNKPYCRDRKKKQIVRDSSAPGTYVAAAHPPRETRRIFRVSLPRFPIPKNVRELLENKKIPNEVADGLSRDSYGVYFKTLLNMEEIKIEDTMRGYDMEGVGFGGKGQFLTLEVPGLAERRPSLVYGDFIYAELASDNGAKAPYQGYIYRVEAEVVNLKFDKDFHSWYRPKNLYNVQFTYNRVNMRKLYQAIDKTRGLEIEILFPSEKTRKRVIRPARLSPISSMLNEEQKRSVQMILGCKGGAPYVIYGPPGTGKTVTIIEAILQIYMKQMQSRVLICAPSNSAADHVLGKLLSELDVDKEYDDILRLNAASRPFEDINPELASFCWFDHECTFTCPPLRDLLRCRIIISTYMSASLLYTEGIKPGHFSHIFLDEAGQASEPETMVPLSQLSHKGTVIVLAGDPMQLGPVIHSKDADHFGLGMSYLERLFGFEPYAAGDENYVMKLVRNYRCHPQILHLPSQLFYNGELIAMKDNATDSQRDWLDLIPKREFPVLFIGIQGCDEREGNNPSWFNRFEASKVVEIIKKLTEKEQVNPEDIGVITPYRQQVLKLTRTLENMNYSGTKVGSVEQFQGQERPVIIISTVRSTVKHNDFDKVHCLGFLSNKKRFNVAITRAMSLLIIIGNPHIIGKDPYWNKLLWHCVDNGSYQGCPLPERQACFLEDAEEESYVADYEPQYPQASDEVPWEDDTHQGENFSEPNNYQVKQQEEENSYYQGEDSSKPNFDESEWSDGWK